jgi:16S rRNA (cytosine1402-N4)-methyltransferase
MRMDQTQDLTANAVVNEWDQTALERVLKDYGEEPNFKRIAASIVNNRPISTTDKLAEVVSKVTPKKGKIHPATKTFQAIRIAVNEEINLLQKALPTWINLLAPGGRIAVISFHSLEDRLVKELFKELSRGRYSKELQIITPKPITAGSTELVSNPRARSAKLRAAVKIKNKEQ